MRRAVLAALLLLAAREGTAGEAAARAKARACFEARKEAAVTACREASTGQLAPASRLLVFETLAAALGELERWPEVVPAWREAVRRLPGEAEAHFRLGQALLLVDAKPEDALPALGEARRLRPQHAATHAVTGLTLQALGRAAEAVDAMEEAERLEPGYLSAHPATQAALDAARGGARWPAPRD